MLTVTRMGREFDWPSETEDGETVSVELAMSIGFGFLVSESDEGEGGTTAARWLWLFKTKKVLFGEMAVRAGPWFSNS